MAIIDHEWEDVDIKEVELSTVPSVKIHFNENDMTNSGFIELEALDLIAMCRALGVRGSDL